MIRFRRFRFPHPFRSLLAAAALTGLVGCNIGISNPAKGVPIVGTWRLVSVNGQPLPAQTGSGWVVRGTLNIGSNVQYTLAETDSAASGLSTFNSAGRWSILVLQVTFLDANSAAYVGTLTQQLDSMSMDINGHTSVYAHN